MEGMGGCGSLIRGSHPSSQTRSLRVGHPAEGLVPVLFTPLQIDGHRKIPHPSAYGVRVRDDIAARGGDAHEQADRRILRRREMTMSLKGSCRSFLRRCRSMGIVRSLTRPPTAYGFGMTSNGCGRLPTAADRWWSLAPPPTAYGFGMTSNGCGRLPTAADRWWSLARAPAMYG